MATAYLLMSTITLPERIEATISAVISFGAGHLAACHFPLQTPTGPAAAELVPTAAGPA